MLVKAALLEEYGRRKRKDSFSVGVMDHSSWPSHHYYPIMSTPPTHDELCNIGLAPGAKDKE